MLTIHQCVLFQFRIKSDRSTCLSPPVIILTNRSKAVLLLWIFYVIYDSRLSCLFLAVLGKGSCV